MFCSPNLTTGRIMPRWKEPCMCDLKNGVNCVWQRIIKNNYYINLKRKLVRIVYDRTSTATHTLFNAEIIKLIRNTASFDMSTRSCTISILQTLSADGSYSDILRICALGQLGCFFFPTLLTYSCFQHWNMYPHSFVFFYYIMYVSLFSISAIGNYTSGAPKIATKSLVR